MEKKQPRMLGAAAIAIPLLAIMPAEAYLENISNPEIASDYRKAAVAPTRINVCMLREYYYPPDEPSSRPGPVQTVRGTVVMMTTSTSPSSSLSIWGGNLTK